MRSASPRLIVLGLGVLGALAATSCRGPQPLDRAIDPADEQAYLARFEDSADTPRSAFLRARARERGISLEQAEAADAGLSTTKNPFDARRDQGAVSRGAVIYSYECVSCHGRNADGRGASMPAVLSSMDFHRFATRFAVTVHRGAPKAWFRAICDGTSVEVDGPDGRPVLVEMPAYEHRLAREQIWLLVTYLQSLDRDLSPAPEDAGS